MARHRIGMDAQARPCQSDTPTACLFSAAQAAVVGGDHVDHRAVPIAALATGAHVVNALHVIRDDVPQEEGTYLRSG